MRVRGVCAEPSKLPDVPAACSRVDENLWLTAGGAEDVLVVRILSSWTTLDRIGRVESMRGGRHAWMHSGGAVPGSQPGVHATNRM